LRLYLILHVTTPFAVTWNVMTFCTRMRYSDIYRGFHQDFRLCASMVSRYKPLQLQYILSD